MSPTDFVPRWASPPGDTIKHALAEQRLDAGSLAAELGLSDEELEAILTGDVPLTIRLAEGLSSTIGGSIEFWITRDGQYWADLARVAADAWAQRMPISEMTTLGWIAPEADDWVGQLEACLNFFNVANPTVWESAHEALVKRARFRISPTVRTDEYAVAAWLRQCEVELSNVSCEAWDRESFAALLPKLRPLTRDANPRRFIPALRTSCAEVGVAVGVVRAPLGCPVSGAAGQLSNGQPSIALSGRYLADDHLWFTFFHEAAHLVLHGADGVYIDELELNSPAPSTALEAEADEYAGTMLVPIEYEDRLTRAKQSPLELRSIANEIGVGLGVMVGQLQHRGVLGYKTKLNRLKNRFKWDGTSLDKA
jgi:HTH-type transcriptional regulator/antitoxin HigA